MRSQSRPSYSLVSMAVVALACDGGSALCASERLYDPGELVELSDAFGVVRIATSNRAAEEKLSSTEATAGPRKEQQRRPTLDGGDARMEYAFEWVEQWYQSPFAFPSHAPSAPTLSSQVDLHPNTGAYLVFLIRTSPESYRLLEGWDMPITVDANNLIHWPDSWPLPSALNRASSASVPLCEAKEFLKQYVADDREQTFVERPRYGWMRFEQWVPELELQRCTFTTKERPDEDLPFRGYWWVKAYVPTERVSPAVIEKLESGKESLAYRITGRWVGGAFLVERITELVPGADLLSHETGTNPAQNASAAKVGYKGQARMALPSISSFDGRAFSSLAESTCFGIRLCADACTGTTAPR